ADDLALDLINQGHAAAALHGDMKQAARTRTLENLKRGRLRVLVATDVAARGIDVQGISHVSNFDLPRQAEDYVHRIGRTGRAGRSGIAISLANVRENFQVKLIERFTTQMIPVITIDGLEPKQKVFDRKPPGKTFNRKGPPRRNSNAGGNAGAWSKDGDKRSSFSKSSFGKPAFSKSSPSKPGFFGKALPAPAPKSDAPGGWKKASSFAAK
ncbi:MAG: helicase-related protein, partial [Burkholderiales bacterium]